MIPVLQFVVLTLIGADVSTEDHSSLLQAQAFQKRATAAAVFDRVALGALQSKSEGLEGATADKKKVEGTTKGKGKSKSKAKKSHHGYELLGDGACMPDLEHEELHRSQDKCIEACSREQNCTGTTHVDGGLCQLSYNDLRGWKQDATVCEDLAAGKHPSVDGTCFHEVVSSNGTKCSDCEVVYISPISYNVPNSPQKIPLNDALQKCDDLREMLGGVYSIAQLDANTCEVFYVKHEKKLTKGWWDRAGSCYKKL